MTFSQYFLTDGDLYFGRFIYIAARRACGLDAESRVSRRKCDITPSHEVAKRGILCPNDAHLAADLTHIDKSP